MAVAELIGGERELGRRRVSGGGEIETTRAGGVCGSHDRSAAGFSAAAGRSEVARRVRRRESTFSFLGYFFSIFY